MLAVVLVILKFQSTLPCRSDRHQDYSATLYMDFNPRSLAGATRNNLLQYRVLKFQSTLPHGSDVHLLQFFNGRCQFQSTLPCGSDGLLLPADIPQDTFQSTLPCRSDIDARGGTRYTEISIHAPLRERQFDRTATSVAHVFQSTLPRGSDLCDVKRYIHLRHFNPRSLAGATRLFLMTILLQKISIHAPSRERHDKVFGYQERYAISIHAPSRERPRLHPASLLMR